MHRLLPRIFAVLVLVVFLCWFSSPAWAASSSPVLGELESASYSITISNNVVQVSHWLNALGPGDSSEARPDLLPANPPENPPRAFIFSKWIKVDLSEQATTAYQGKIPLKTVLVSTGLPRYPTPVGEFKVYLKVRSQTMTGGVGADRYVLPGVPWIMYFSGGNALHGTYWHKDFGRPKSHGCVNMTIADAKWFYEWAEVGTPVIVKP